MLNETQDQSIRLNESKSHFLENDKFELTKRFQQQVFEATEVNPTIRRLVNAVITEENLVKVVNRMIESLKQ